VRRAALLLALAAGAVAGPALGRSHAQCPWRGEGPVLRVFAAEARWREAFTGPEEGVLGAPVDWAAQDVLVFALGQQRTLGVTVAAEPSDLAGTGRHTRLDVTITRPGPDDMAAMALSRPCVVLAVPKRTWSRVEVRDRTRGEVVWRGRPKVRR